MNNASNENLKYYSQLDGLRCFAVVSIMVAHWISWDTNIYILKNLPWGNGVILFFVLSGYLISNILFELKEKVENKSITFKGAIRNFYIRRFLRIFPAYYLLLFYLYYINHANTQEIFPWLLSFTSNLYECKTGNFVGDFNHFWSLAVEEQFYITYPFIILLVNKRFIFKTILFLMLVSVLSRFLCFLFVPDWKVSAFFTLNLFFPLCLGSLLAYARRYNEKLTNFFSSYKLMLFSVLFFSAFFYFHTYIKKNDFMKFVCDEYVFAVACAFIIFRASRNKFKYVAGFVLSHEVVVYLGKISYGLYLYHLFIIGFYWNYFALRFEVNIKNMHMIWVVYFVLTFVIATFSYYVIEKPFNNLKKNFKY